MGEASGAPEESVALAAPEAKERPEEGAMAAPQGMVEAATAAAAAEDSARQEERVAAPQGVAARVVEERER